MPIDQSARSLRANLKHDLGRKLVVLTGARQAGKTTLARQLMAGSESAQYLSWDVPTNRQLIGAHAWTPKARLLVFDEIHKMRDWKAFLKGAWDGRAEGQAVLVTGSAHMDTFRQGGESLAGRYVTDLVREDVLDFSRVHEVRTLQLLLDMLRKRVGSPLKLSGLAQALQISPTTAARYVDILEALYIVFRVTPWHRDVARSLLKEPKIYFLDNGLVRGGAGALLENAVAAMLLKHCHYRQDAEGKAVTLHTIRDKERHEIDFVLAEGDIVTDLVEVKLGDATPSAFLNRMAERFAPARALHLVAELRQPAQHGRVEVASLDEWLAELAA